MNTTFASLSFSSASIYIHFYYIFEKKQNHILKPFISIHTMLTQNTISYENNLLLASILCLLLVILFVLLLHIYARWLLTEGRLCGATMAGIFGPTTRLRRPHTTSSTTYTYDLTSLSSCSYQTKGLEQKVIGSIPTFIYRPSSSEGVVLECAICLSAFEEMEVGRSLPRCSHAFHVECIDMWLCCHSTCPICRAHVGVDDQVVEEGCTDGVDENQTVVVHQDRDRILSTSGDQIVVDFDDVGFDVDQNVASSECSTVDCS